MHSTSAVMDYVTFHAKVGDRAVQVPALLSTARLLATQRVNTILVPAASDEVRELYRDHQHLLAPSARRHVKLVDSSGALRRRVKQFIAPIEEDLTRNRNEANDYLARVLGESLYHIGLGLKYNASTIDTPIHSFCHALHSTDLSPLGAESKYRLSLASGFLLSYQPQSTSTMELKYQNGEAAAPGLFQDMLDAAEFSDVTEAFGRLGYLRRPITGLRRLRAAIRTWCGSPQAKGAAAIAETVGQYAGTPIPAELARGFAQDVAIPDFAPPLVALGHGLGIYWAALAEFSEHCVPYQPRVFCCAEASGDHFAGKVHGAFNCGEFLLPAKPHPSRVASLDEHIRGLQGCRQDAQNAVRRLSV